MFNQFFYSLKRLPVSILSRSTINPLGRWSVISKNPNEKELKAYMANYDNEQSQYLYSKEEASSILNKNKITNKNKNILEQFYLTWF
jgi:hypothetical protein